jgi:hypothetical protein
MAKLKRVSWEMSIDSGMSRRSVRKYHINTDTAWIDARMWKRLKRRLKEARRKWRLQASRRGTLNERGKHR